MKSKLQYKDLINLEYFFARDTEIQQSDLHIRDREIALNLQDQIETTTNQQPKQLILGWLKERGQRDFAGETQKSPGNIFQEMLHSTSFLVTLTGIITGSITGFAYFSYSGTTPVNILQFLALFIVSQLLLTVFLISGLLLRRLMPSEIVPSFYLFLFSGLLYRLSSFLKKKWQAEFSTEKRMSAEQAFGILRGKSTLYSSLFYWPFFCIAQLFGLTFNIGLLLATFTRISTSDIAFGWQSTIQFSAETIHSLVQLLATPWAWIFENGGHPNLAEIAGSKIILKDGIHHLATADLVAWWPFLIMCVLFYGLTVRAATLCTGMIMSGKTLSSFTLDSGDCTALLRRLRTPLITTQADPEPSSTPTHPAEIQIPEIGTQSKSAQNQFVLIPADIYEACVSEISKHLPHLGMSIKRESSFLANYEDDQSLLTRFSRMDWESDEGVFIVMEGWMVPLVDFLSYLRQLREVLPPKMTITVGLLGRPTQSIFTPVTEKDFAIWQLKIESIGDPWLQLLSIKDNA